VDLLRPVYTNQLILFDPNIMIGMQVNPYTITNEERQNYDLQFNKLFPVNGFLSSNQAAPFFLQSNLNKLQLQQIWSLADFTQDGKLDRLEFAIAMKLIKLSLNGIPLPTYLPPSMQFIGNTNSPAHSTTSSNGSALSRRNSLKDITTKSRSNSQEFGIQKQMRLKYIQRFNFEDRSKCGFLSGVQARHVLNESRLPKHTLAEIWKLSDLNQNGKLTQDEFVIAMHLVDQVKAGNILPSVLPANLLPSSYRNTPPMGIQPGQMMPNQIMSAQRSRQNSLDALPTESVFSSFEDKRRENIEKGQKELEKRRQALLEQERKERELKEQKEREERERLEKIRLEQERKKEEEMKRRMEQQLKEEQEREEARRKEQERKIQAQKEMERQRMLEAQRIKRKELTQQKLKLQEEVSKLRAKSQTVDYEKQNIDSQKEKLFEQCKELEEKMTATQDSLANITQMHQQSHMLAVKSQNDLEICKGNLDTVIMTKQQLSSQIISPGVNDGNISVLEEDLKTQRISCDGLKTELEIQKQSYLARQKELNSLQSHLNELRSQFSGKQAEKEQLDNEINFKNNQLIGLKKQRENLIRRRNSTERKEKLEKERQIQKELEAKKVVEKEAEETRKMVENMQLGAQVENDKPKEDIRKKIAEMQIERSKKQKQASQAAVQPSKTFKLSQDASTLPTYKALFAFTASRPDELSLKEGDIVNVDESQDAEHEWLLGSKNGKAGWFPANYVQKIQNAAPKPAVTTENNFSKFSDASSNENNEKNVSNLLKSGATSAFVPTPFVAPNQPQQVQPAPAVKSSDDKMHAVTKVRAKFPFDAPKDTHLKFAKDDIIVVTEKQDKWWKGRCHEKSGWFPKSYVKPIETSTPTLGAKSKSQKTSPLVKRKAPQPPVAATRKKNQKAKPKAPSNEYVAAFDFAGEQDGDLPFVTGDVIVVTLQDGDWWTGKLGGKEGIFPGNYVSKKQDPPQPSQAKPAQETSQQAAPADEDSSASSSADKPEIAVVIADYKATSAEQLSLTKGGYVQVRKKSEKGWWEGISLMAPGKKQSGWFPADYVKLKDAAGKTDQAVKKPAEKLVYAMYDYQAINSDELTFKMDDVIVVVEDADADWWKGYLKSDQSKSQGHFPRNYVRTSNP